MPAASWPRCCSACRPSDGERARRPDGRKCRRRRIPRGACRRRRKAAWSASAISSAAYAAGSHSRPTSARVVVQLVTPTRRCSMSCLGLAAAVCHWRRRCRRRRAPPCRPAHRSSPAAGGSPPARRLAGASAAGCGCFSRMRCLGSSGSAAIELRRRVVEQRPRLGVGDPGRRLGADQPVEEQQRDDDAAGRRAPRRRGSRACGRARRSRLSMTKSAIFMVM